MATTTIIDGNIVANDDPSSFRKELRIRRKKYEEGKFPASERTAKEGEGWVWKFNYKKGGFAKFHRPKGDDRLFEDQVWLLFYEMGFEQLNEDSPNFRIRYGDGDSDFKQIDVFAKHRKHIFIVECKSSTTGNPSVHASIAEMKSWKDGVEKYLKKHFSEHDLKITFILWTRNYSPPSDRDENMASSAGIHILQDKEFSYFDDVSCSLGEPSRYIFYSYLFSGKDIGGDPFVVPALKGNISGHTYYLFKLEPINLIEIAYIHHRNPVKERSYQRMIKKSKINSIVSFLDDDSKFFGNNIIINFKKEVEFNKLEGTHFEIGELFIPRVYSSAWIIDGQHRLLGNVKNKRRNKDKIPILAFDNLSDEEEAEIFIDINENQTKVPSDLRWDIAGEMYGNSPQSSKNYTKFLISNLVKTLNKNARECGFVGRIKIPSHEPDYGDPPHLTMTSLCDAFLKTDLLSERGRLRGTGVDPAEKIDNFTARRIRWIFELIANSSIPEIKEDWEKREEGFLFSNNGMVILIYIIEEIINHIHPNFLKKGKNDFQGEIKKYLDPLLEKVRKKGEDGRNEWRANASNEGVRRNIKCELLAEINAKIPGFASTTLHEWKPEQY